MKSNFQINDFIETIHHTLSFNPHWYSEINTKIGNASDQFEFPFYTFKWLANFCWQRKKLREIVFMRLIFCYIKWSRCHVKSIQQRSNLMCLNTMERKIQPLICIKLAKIALSKNDHNILNDFYFIHSNFWIIIFLLLLYRVQKKCIGSYKWKKC